MANISAITKENSDYIMINFLNMDTVREKANEINKITAQIDDWIISLEREIYDGGLDQYALNIGGDPILNTNAINLVNNLKQRKLMAENLKTDIIALGKKHRKAELDKLEQVLIQRIKDNDKKINSLNSKVVSLGERPIWPFSNYAGTKENQIAALKDDNDKAWLLIKKVRRDECFNYVGGE